ncbi:hypothetical protein H7F33_03300 [Pedobacter sp. PAMC26386]|nr:hypothetical protein H7F33_03300 [Pedobacter sp. PAMC26386]
MRRLYKGARTTKDSCFMIWKNETHWCLVSISGSRERYAAIAFNANGSLKTFKHY